MSDYWHYKEMIDRGRQVRLSAIVATLVFAVFTVLARTPWDAMWIILTISAAAYGSWMHAQIQQWKKWVLDA